MKKLESVKNDMFALQANKSKTVVGGMYTTVDFVTCLKNGKQVLDKKYDTNI